VRFLDSGSDEALAEAPGRPHSESHRREASEGAALQENEMIPRRFQN